MAYISAHYREMLNSKPSKLRQVWPLVDLKRYQEDVCSELVTIENLPYGHINLILENYQVEPILQVLNNIVNSKCLLHNALTIYESQLRHLAKINSRIYDITEEKYHNLGRAVIYATVNNSPNSTVNKLELRADAARFYDSISRKLIKYGQETVLGVKEYMCHPEQVFDKPLPSLPAKSDISITKRKSVSELSNSSSQLSLHRFDTSSLFSDNSGKGGEDESQRTQSIVNNKRLFAELPDLPPLMKNSLFYSSIMEESFDMEEKRVEEDVINIEIADTIENLADNKIVQNEIQNEFENVILHEIYNKSDYETDNITDIETNSDNQITEIDHQDDDEEDDNDDEDDCFHLLNSFAEVGPAPKVSSRRNFFKNTKPLSQVSSKAQTTQPSTSASLRFSRIYKQK